MATKPLDRLMFAQGGLCFFCKEPLPRAEASVEHLVASANGGGSDLENCVACCKTVNTLLGSMSLKEKIQVVLNQRGVFRCPNRNTVIAGTSATPAVPKQAVSKSIPASDAAPKAKSPKPGQSFTREQTTQVIDNLKSRGSARPSTLKALTATVTQLLGKQLAPTEIEALLEHLRAEGVFKVRGTKVSYELPTGS